MTQKSEQVPKYWGSGSALVLLGMCPSLHTSSWDPEVCRFWDCYFWSHLQSHLSHTGVPPSSRVCLLCQQPEGWLLHERQHHSEVQVLR